jgi:hypothetical protein
VTNRQVLLALLAAILGGFLFADLRRGQISGWAFERYEQPILFWFGIAYYVTIIAMCFVLPIIM